MLMRREKKPTLGYAKINVAGRKVLTAYATKKIIRAFSYSQLFFFTPEVVSVYRIKMSRRINHFYKKNNNSDDENGRTCQSTEQWNFSQNKKKETNRISHRVRRQYKKERFASVKLEW